jgi:hypothetical protein
MGRDSAADAAAAAAILDNVPDEWRGTTFNNSELLGRAKFSERLEALLKSKKPIRTESLEALGNAEDYLRVATNLSTTLEFFLAREKGVSVQQVFTFASEAMPLAAVLLTAAAPTPVVHLYYGSAEPPYTPEEHSILSLLGATLHLHRGPPPTAACALPAAGEVVLWGLGPEDPPSADGPSAAPSAFSATTCPPCVDGVIAPGGVLYVTNPRTIDPEQIAVVRKRMATPATTPMCEAGLRRLAGAGELAEAARRVSSSEAAALHTHLQALCGAPADASSDALPQLFTAGLPALASLWLALLSTGGAEIVMCSTAYGGSSQLTDLLCARSQACAPVVAEEERATPAPALLRKHTFAIQGDADVTASIGAALTALGEAHGLPESVSTLMPTVVLFVETPTNPDMKVPDLHGLVRSIAAFQTAYRYRGAFTPRVLLLLDATLAPCSRPLEKLRELAPTLPAMVFLSLSKSVSRGLTTAGCLVPNTTKQAQDLMGRVAATAATLDTGARPDQQRRLVDHHEGVEARCERAYGVAVAVGAELTRAVRELTKVDMRLAFVTQTQAEGGGCYTSTFSFNLPPPGPGASEEAKAGLAQRFVDLLTSSRPKLFKPCVSFGQDNGLVYCTVPATSTQGAIKAEDKAKQAVGGVQLVRLSFPPTIDKGLACKAIREAVTAIYDLTADSAGSAEPQGAGGGRPKRGARAGGDAAAAPPPPPGDGGKQNGTNGANSNNKRRRR